MYFFHTNNYEHRLTMISIKSNIKVSFKLPKAIITGAFIIGTAMSAAHSELVIQEKDPSTTNSTSNQFNALKNADIRSLQLHQFIAELNQRLTGNPKDAVAWAQLAQIYYDHGYHDYAVYAASEAVDLGQSTPEMKKILLNSSALISQKQLQSGYLTNEADPDFVKEYQYALSKIYGDIYGFNYDESLPQPVIKPRRAKPKTSYRPPVKRQAQPSRATSTKRKAAAKPSPRPVPRAKPVQKPAPSAPKNSNSKSADPFSILR